MYTLITAASSAQAYRLKNSLNSPDILLGDFKDLPGVMVKTGRMIRLPDPGSSSYTHQMLKLCLDHGINAIYPLGREEQLLLTEAEQLFSEYNIIIIVTANEV